MKKELSQEYLKSLFDYKDGELFWKVNKGNRKIGDKAGSINSNGYSHIKIDFCLYKTHRIIFMLNHGFMPKFIDHINGNKIDNKIENLREATSSQNNQNSQLRKDNKIGIKGVSFCNVHNKWRVAINVYGKQKSIGYFKDLELVELVAIEARDKYHGKYARSF